MLILNLGCGLRTSPDPDVVNIDRSPYLRIKRNFLLRLLVPVLLRGERAERYSRIPDNVVLHDLRRGIPFGPDSVDAVYHSHLLEHLSRAEAEHFLLEIRRVLKPGGIQRIVVPDLERSCRRCLSHLARCDADPSQAGEHDRYVAAIIEQCVRREAAGTGRQGPLRRFAENLLVGDASRRGEAHQWLYDRANLAALLARTGYVNFCVQRHDTSLIPGWTRYGLDGDHLGVEHLTDSLFVEARKG